MINQSNPSNFDEKGLPKIDSTTGPYNLWYYYRDADTVLVLVHGILSDIRSCWLNVELGLN
jgi:hypothetical protein